VVKTGICGPLICKIALGEIHIFISAKLKAWDFAAAGIILNEVESINLFVPAVQTFMGFTEVRPIT
jgi:fructose-1,6-bisphosphatase/inositol monophosphatase family enzyme